jgi:hypothetical protein
MIVRASHLFSVLPADGNSDALKETRIFFPIVNDDMPGWGRPGGSEGWGKTSPIRAPFAKPLSGKPRKIVRFGVNENGGNISLCLPKYGRNAPR